jgi:3-oxoacyl-[acyl-carrier-protein] synthase II
MSSVALAGLGAVTGYGSGVDALWDGVLAGRSAGRMQSVDGVDNLVARVPNPDDLLDAAGLAEWAVLTAAAEAIDDAKARGWAPDGPVGIIHCTGIGDIRLMRDNYFRSARVRPSLFAHVLLTTPASLLAKRYGYHGPNVVVNAACASANVACLLARSWMDAGVVDSILLTAAEFCVIAEIINGFRQLRVLVAAGNPFEVCRPFQEGSLGFFLGEGAVAAVVTRRVDRPWARVLGGASTHDGFHITAVNPDGVEVRRCFELALADAAVDARAVDYVHAHGTGTRVNDSVEAAAVDALFDGHTRIHSTKPFTGHCMAASAGVQLLLTAAACNRGTVPASPVGTPSTPRLLTATEPHRGGVTACAALGLGGYNSVVLVDSP